MSVIVWIIWAFRIMGFVEISYIRLLVATGIVLIIDFVIKNIVESVKAGMRMNKFSAIMKKEMEEGKDVK